MTQSNWDESTESKFLTGSELPQQGLEVTMTSILIDEMQKRDAAEGVKETVFIGQFSEVRKGWVINKTGRKWLKEHCGINNQTISNFQPIPLTLIPNETNMGTGIKPILRAVAAAAPVAPAARVPLGGQAPAALGSQTAESGPPPLTDSDEQGFEVL